MASPVFIEDAVLFSLDLPESVNRLLQAAVIAARHDKTQAEQLFIQAYQTDPHCLQSYFALYKFYFYQARLTEAEYYVLAGLEEAARQGGIAFDYQLLYQNYSSLDMYANESRLFYLYTLKALAFIKLRQNHVSKARSILNIIQALDSEDRSGASVIMDLTSAVEEE